MPMPDYQTLLDTHFALLSGSYFSGFESGPAKACYAWSRLVPDEPFNFAANLAPDDLDWAFGAARRHGRPLSVLVQNEGDLDRLRADPRFAIAHGASWMVLSCSENPIPPLPRDGFTVTASPEPVPPDGFVQIMGRLFEDEAVNDHVKRHYATALTLARPLAQGETHHFTLWSDGMPAACATIHVLGNLAGLYNVATIRTHRGQGLGRAISMHAARFAQGLGCRHVFLQCEAGSAAERLYERIGFRTRYSPFLACFQPEA